jgi:hypothetical protein
MTRWVPVLAGSAIKGRSGLPVAETCMSWLVASATRVATR